MKVSSEARFVFPIAAAGLGLAGAVVFGVRLPANAPARPADAVAAGVLADPGLTPGRTLPVTASETCDPGYAKRHRSVPSAVRPEVFRRYGIALSRHALYEVDHLIPLSLGGSNDLENLHPELWEGPYGAHAKDRLEFRLYTAVCRGEMTLLAAQSVFRGDWRAEYRRRFGDPANPKIRADRPDEPHDTEGFPILKGEDR